MNPIEHPQAPGKFPINIGFWLGLLLSLGILLFTDLDPENPLVTRVAAIVVLMAIWWMTEAIPLAATSLIPLIAFPLLGVMPGGTVASAYVNDIVFLFIGGFLVAIAMEHWNLHRRIALRTLLLVGSSAPMLLLGFMAATAFISMWISNTATAMMMVPIAMAVLKNLEDDNDAAGIRGFGIVVLLGIAYSASLGGVATLVGTPANLVLVQSYAVQFPDAEPITFTRWMFFAGPFALMMLALVWVYMVVTKKLFGLKINGSRQMFREQHRLLGRISYEQAMVGVLFVVLAFLWLTRSSLEIGDRKLMGWQELFAWSKFPTDGTVAIVIALLLFIIPSRAEPGKGLLNHQSFSQVPWDIVLLFGGGFALADGFAKSGLSAWVGGQFDFLSGVHPLLILMGVCLIVTFMTELTSNTASAQILMPVLAAQAVALDLPPLYLMVPGAISCSLAFMLPVGTPPNAIVFGTKWVTIREMMKCGLFLNLVGVVALALLSWLLGDWLLK